MESPKPLRIAAVADLHYDKRAAGKHRALFEAASREADVLLLCGDLTDYGLVEEAEVLAEDLRQHCTIPVLATFGNHDHESGQVDDVCEVLDRAKVKVLDGSSFVLGDVGFVGVKGFGGGFGRWALSAWGEAPIKAFVQAAVDEALKLDAALSRLDTEHQAAHRVALLHYAPIAATVEGEPEEIFPFCGSSRLEDTLDRHAVAVAFHGHAHAGTPEGRTRGGVPVYNVSIPVLQRAFPERPPFRLITLDPAAEPDEALEAATASEETTANDQR